jgi:hypothetical protein
MHPPFQQRPVPWGGPSSEETTPLSCVPSATFPTWLLGSRIGHDLCSRSSRQSGVLGEEPQFVVDVSMTVRTVQGLLGHLREGGSNMTHPRPLANVIDLFKSAPRPDNDTEIAAKRSNQVRRKGSRQWASPHLLYALRE